MSCKRPGRFRRLMGAVGRLLVGDRGAQPPPEPPGPEEPALVPIGPPRRRPPAGAVALELPTETDPLVYPTEVEAVGQPLLSAEREEEPGRRRRAWVPPLRWIRRRWAGVLSLKPLRRSQPVS